MIFVNIGRHRVSGLTADEAAGSTVVEVAGGDLKEVNLKLVAANRTVIINNAAKPTLSKLQKLAVASWAMGGGMLIGAGVAGLFASSAAKKLDKDLDMVPTTPADVHHDRDSARRLALSTDILAGAGVVLIGTGALLWVKGRKSSKGDQAPPASGAPESSKQEPQARLQWNLGYGTLSVRGQF
jgi:hypothetical protein